MEVIAAMNFKKVAIWLMLLSLCGGTIIFANAAAQKVRVLINGMELDSGGIIMDGTTYLPLRQVANTMQAIVEWDNASRKATVYKPNVHMFMYQGNSPFGVVNKGFSGKIKVFSQIDNLQTDIKSVKVTIADPSGKEKLIQSENVTSSNNFWFVTEEFDYKFDAVGQYTVRFYMKVSDADDWVVVSEKEIPSVVPKK